MAAIDIEKYVSRQIAAHNGHKLSEWTKGRNTLTATCGKCATEFVIDLRGDKRCATNLHAVCVPNDELRPRREKGLAQCLTSSKLPLSRKAQHRRRWLRRMVLRIRGPEEGGYEDGNYYNECVQCNTTFIGHKRRQLCKVCTTANEARWNAMSEEERKEEIARLKREIATIFAQNGAMTCERSGPE